MTSSLVRTWLIAAREFKTYTGTISFWVALVLGPAIMSGVVVVAPALRPPPPAVTRISAQEPHLAAKAAAALREAAALGGTSETIEQSPSGKEADTKVEVSRSATGAIHVRVTGRPLTPIARALLARDLAAAGPEARALDVVLPALDAQPASEPAQGAPLGRLAIAFILWTNLVGALGMLLQSVVRERATRVLETLLAAARPLEIMLGKLAGVGGVSLMVVGLWLGSGGLLAAVGAGRGQAALLQVMFQDLTSPATAIYLMGIYLVTYLAYGAALLGVGALARDDVAAQNLTRPFYAVLVLVFFAMLADLQAKAPDWLLWAPPFTPFLMLIRTWLTPSQLIGPGLLFLACAVAAAAGAVFAIRGGRPSRPAAKPAAD